MFFCWLDYTVIMVLLQFCWCVTLGSGLSMLEFEWLQVFCKADFASLLALRHY